eukprot:354230-Chlamydomonas_euryale.AAC.2
MFSMPTHDRSCSACPRMTAYAYSAAYCGALSRHCTQKLPSPVRLRPIARHAGIRGDAVRSRLDRHAHSGHGVCADD